MLSLAFAGPVPTETGKIALSFTRAIHVVSSWGVLFWSCGPCLLDIVLNLSWGVLPPHMGRKHPRGGEVENGKPPSHVFRGGRFAVHTFMQSASSPSS